MSSLSHAAISLRHLADESYKLSSLVAKPSDAFLTQHVPHIEGSLREKWERLVSANGLPGGYNNIPIKHAFTGSPNAITMYAKEDDSYAVAFDIRAHSLILYLLEAGCFWISDRQSEWEFKSKVISTAIGASVNLLFAKESPSEEEQEVIKYVHQNTGEVMQYVTVAMTNAILEFILAHELAHIVLGHFHKGDFKQSALDDAVGEGQHVSLFQHQKEYEADEWAHGAIRKLPNRYFADAPIPFADLQIMRRLGPSLFWKIWNVALWFYTPEFMLAKELISSHPRPLDRAKRLPLDKPELTDEEDQIWQLIMVMHTAFDVYNEGLQEIHGPK